MTLLARAALLAGLALPAASDVPAPACDCNGNGYDDAVDIALGTSTDEDGNGVPDECEEAPGAGPRGLRPGPLPGPVRLGGTLCIGPSSQGRLAARYAPRRAR